jgi:Tol biopolymer transport system component/tRNA A-37 threonylcarbamoyl transferase component Bud32
MIGESFGHFRILSRLGAGGMGVVYRAHDEKLQRTVAIKVVERVSGATAADGTRIVEEARAASGLTHPNICTVYETGDINGKAYIAMEFVDGKPLSESIPTGGLPTDAVVRYGIQIADALAHAHKRGVIHRDLKTANVVITPDGRAKVLDFGLARRVPSELATTVTRSSDSQPAQAIAGTLAYLAPEALLGDVADERSDIWALGVLLYEIVAGELPFKGRNEFDLTAAILRESPGLLPQSVPAIIRAIIQRCLAKEPSRRYQHAVEVRAALEAVQSDAGAVSTPPSVPRYAWKVVAASLLIAAVVGALALWRQRDTRSVWERAASDRRLTLTLASEDAIYDPAISADGKMLCYVVEGRDGRTDLFVRRVAGGSLVRVTNDDARETSPRFSPDGDRIAFARREPRDGTPDIRIVSTFGGDSQSVIPSAGAPVWSPDGKELAFIHRRADGTLELVTAAADGANPHVVLSADSELPFLRDPAWSPDGRELAIVRGSGGIAGGIWLVSARGGAPRRAMSDPPEVFSESPAYTADGLGIIHSSNRGGATNIWFYPRTGGAPVRLTAGPGPDAGPTVAANGTIAFINSRWRNTLNLYSLAGGAARTLTTHSPFMWGPVFSPDGSDIAFSRSEVDGSWHIWRLPASGGTPQRLTDTADGEVYPRYSHDGSVIVFHTWGTPRRIGRVARAGGAPVMLTFGDTSDGYPDLSRDGQSIAFTRIDPTAERIYVAPAAGGAARLLTESPGAVPKWSPDGKRLAFAANRGYFGGIFVANADGNNVRRLTAAGGWPVWWPDGTQIAFIVTGRNGDQEIQTVPVAGGSPRPLTGITFSGSNHLFDISPDGTMLVTTNAVHVSDEIWLVESGQRR